MRYFFLAYALIVIMVIGIFGFRGDKFEQPPIEIFPDMDHQDKIKAQTGSDFFQDGLGSRKPVPGTQPLGLGNLPETEFGGQDGYYFTGAIGDHYGTGMPEELELKAEELHGFLARGAERYNISCMPCHGQSGNGGGIAAQFGVPGVANLMTDTFGSEAYPDGRMYDVITNGKGQMGEDGGRKNS